MNRDSEALQSLFAWLLQDPPINASPQAGDFSSSGTSAGDDGVEDLELADIDPLDSEEENPPISNHRASQVLPPDRGGQQLKLGDIPAVQDRFHALLKRRMQIEIQEKLPLFPWETEVSEYPDCGFEAQVPEQSLWTAQLQTLKLPVRVPETVLAPLLDRCQELVQSSLREGVKLVRAVEALFPDQSQTLNNIAGKMLLGPARGGYDFSFPDTYEAATQAEQILLSLLAAREIVGNLTLKVSPAQMRVERQWLTAAGVLSLDGEYQPEGQFPRLRIQSQLPCGGSLQLRCGQALATAQRPDGGCLSVEIFDPQPGQTYSLEVRFQNLENKPLMLAVCPTL